MQGTRINNCGFAEQNKNVKEGDCIFPFKQKGILHTECIDGPKGAYCATEVNPKTLTLKKYGYCHPADLPNSTDGEHGPYEGLETTEVPLMTAALARSKKLTQKSTTAPGPTRRTLKVVSKSIPKKRTLKIKRSQVEGTTKDMKDEFIAILYELEDMMHRFGEPYRALAYQRAAVAIAVHMKDTPVTSVAQVAGLPGVGKTIIKKLQEYVDTGKINALDKRKGTGQAVLTQVYGVGAKKAAALVALGYNSVEELSRDIDKEGLGLSAATKLGLRYFDDIEERIPRCEIEEFEDIVTPIFESSTPPGSRFEIAGSYRRGAPDSGDIDIVVTNENPEEHAATFDGFVAGLKEAGIIKHILAKKSKGAVKCLALAQVPGSTRMRRLDVFWASPKQYAFALLHFTGNKDFNTMQRQRALDMGYTLNQEGIYHMVQNAKGEHAPGKFPDEQSIFKFLKMKYMAPEDRKGGRAVIPLDTASQPSPPRRRTLKITTVSPSKLLTSFKQKGASYLDTLTESNLTRMLKTANQQYYNNKTPLLSDDQYDILREHTLKTHPGNVVAQNAHTDVDMTAERGKTTLPYQMWSMDKIKPDSTALERWVAKFSGPYVLSAKLDGVSGLYTTEGETPKLYTRGNGVSGQDVSHIIPYLRLPTQPGLVIRGEFIIKKAVFEETYAQSFANPRNLVAGLINSKKTTAAKLRSIDFVAYELIKPEVLPSLQLQALRDDYDVLTVLFMQSETVSNGLLSELLVSWRQDYEYEIDGVICTDDSIQPRKKGNPEHSFAFKMVLSDQIAEVKVIDVIWTASKDGYLKPRVQFEPIMLGGVKIVQATGFNAKFIVENHIGLGATVSLIRSGDVIPHILDVIKPAPEPMLPDVPYVWNATHVDILLKDKKGNSTVALKVIVAFFKSIGVEGLREGIVRTLMAAGYDSVPKILAMTKGDFLALPKFKEKLATKIHEGIAKALEEASLPTLMHASNIFGRGFGKKKLTAILAKLPSILTSDATTDAKVSELVTVEKIAKKSATAFVHRIGDFLEWLKEAKLEHKLQAPAPVAAEIDDGHPLYGKQIVMTGFRDAGLVKLLESLGATVASAVSKNTFVVIVKNLDEDTGKAEKARELGIPIETIQEFTENHGLGK